MGFRKGKVLLTCYLMMTSMVFNMIQADTELSNAEMDGITNDMLEEYRRELDEAIAKAPENPDNDVDDEDRPRFFFLFALIPKILLVVAKIALKAVPIIIKAAAVVKAKIAATAIVAATAVKAKVVTTVAATAAKFATGAAIKQTVITGVVKVAKFAVETIVVDAITDKVTEAITGPSEEETQTTRPVLKNVFDYYDNDDECECTSNEHCGCCVHPKNMLKACMNMTFLKPLWHDDSEIKIGTYYGDKEVLIRVLKARVPRQRCLPMSKPFAHTKICVSTHGRLKVGRRINQCFSVHFDHRGLTRCVVQDKKNNVWFLEDE